MRHRKTGRQLNRNSSHRSAMFQNMTVSLLRHEIIKTTLPKAKELRRIAEPLVTKLFNDLGPRYRERPGGYLRILKAGFRTGDKAPMAYIEMVDRPQAEAGEDLAT